MRYFIFILLFTYGSSYAQYVPQRFVLKTNDLANDFNNVKINYKFFTGVLDRDNNISYSKYEKKPNPFDDHHSKETIYTYIYLSNTNHKNNTLILRIK